jgi:hypothetical protein
MQTYINKRAGFIMGRYRPEGAEIKMTDSQARLYLMEGRIERPTRAPQLKRSAPKKSAARKDTPEPPDAGDGTTDS